jgi:PilX N-terminal
MMPKLYYFTVSKTRGKKSVKNHGNQGIALMTTMLVLLLLSAMTVGVSWLVLDDQKLGGNNSDRQHAFYGAEAGMESLTASLENLFDSNYAPDKTAINNLLTNPGPPANIPSVQYIAAGSSSPGSGYQITFTPSPSNANLPTSSFGTIPSGTYAGLVGLMTPYTLTVTARTTPGSEVKLQRVVQTVGIPVFQFGVFSQTDLDFFAGPNFNFGGRVHTNGNLWLAEGDGNTLTMSQKVTAAGEIITKNLENGWLTSSNYNGAVKITTGSGVANLISQAPDQSVIGNANYIGSIGPYDTGFKGMANSKYNNNIAVKETGVKPLNVSIATPAIGGQPIDQIRRPQHNEDTSNSAKLAERYYSQVSLRILLSDYGPSGGCTDSDISSTSSTALPSLAPNGTSPATPVDLATLAWDTSATAGAGAPPYNAAPSWLTGVGTSTFPLPVSGAATTSYSATDGYWIQQYYPIITGCIKVEYQSKTSPGTWADVTKEILNLGYTGRNINPQGSSGFVAPPTLASLPSSRQNAQGPTAHAGVSTVGCADPSTNAVIRLARVRDNPSSGFGCGTASQHGTDYWPNVLYDTREALLRDTALGSTQLTLAGAMHYVELDVANLAKWFTGATGTNGANVLATNGYSIYFSDRRGEVPDPAPPASVATTPALTGGFGYEDFVNPASGGGCPNGTLDQGEDVEGDYLNGVDAAPVLRTYGGIPTLDNSAAAGIVVSIAAPTTVLSNHPSCTAPGISWPYAVANQAQDLRENPPALFRGALKLVHGDTISLGTCNSVSCGLAVISENPVYVQGCYNNPGQCGMTSVSWSSTSVGASVIGDAVTLLSDEWNDVNSFAFPYNLNKRTAVTTTYRIAVMAGKGVPFQQPAGTAADFGTDGGVHNFLRYLENWGGQTLYYEGSIAGMYYNHQAVGVYKCCNTVYSPPTRGYQFDTNFLTPSLLPPLTPMLRTINTVGFTQMMLPTQ